MKYLSVYQAFLLFSMVILFSNEMAFSQTNDITWQECLGVESIYHDYSRGITYHNNFIYAGIRIPDDGPNISNYHGGSDIWIVCMDSTGHMLWEKCYGGSEGESPRKVLSRSKNEIILFGVARSMDGDVQNGKPADMWVVEIDTLGNILWERSYGNRSCEPRDIILTPDKGILLMGRITNAGGDISVYYGSYDIWLCKVDSSGNIQWEKTLGNVENDNLLKIKLTSENTLLMVGGHYDSGGMIDCPDLGDDGADVWIVELDLNGNLLNQWCFGGSHNDLGYDIIECNDGYVFVASTNSNDGDVSGLHIYGGTIHDDIWVVKFNKQGELIWQNCFGGSESDYPIYLTQTSDQGYIIIGNTWSHNGDVVGNHSSPGSGWADMWLVKVDSLGELEWQRCIGGINNERFWGTHNVAKKSDYNYVLAGQSKYADGDVECDPFGYPDDDAWIFEIKDCALFMPEKPGLPTASDSVCTSIDTITTVHCEPASGAWYYEWDLSPVEAGTIIGTDTEATVTWTKNWEGDAVISVRSANDCGYSD